MHFVIKRVWPSFFGKTWPRNFAFSEEFQELSTLQSVWFDSRSSRPAYKAEQSCEWSHSHWKKRLFGENQFIDNIKEIGECCLSEGVFPRPPLIIVNSRRILGGSRRFFSSAFRTRALRWRWSPNSAHNWHANFGMATLWAWSRVVSSSDVVPLNAIRTT